MGIQERKEREKERRRNEIIDAAERVIFSQGIDKATVDAIAQEAELSKATVYLYFKSKEEIYFAISMRGQEMMLEMIRKSMAGLASIEDKIRAFLTSVIRFKEQFPDYFEAFNYFLSHQVNLDPENDYVKEARARHQKYLRIWSEMVEKEKQQGKIRPAIHVQAAVIILYLQLCGFLRSYAVIQDRLREDFDLSFETLFETYLEMVLGGLVQH